MAVDATRPFEGQGFGIRRIHPAAGVDGAFDRRWRGSASVVGRGWRAAHERRPLGRTRGGGARVDPCSACGATGSGAWNSLRGEVRPRDQGERRAERGREAAGESRRMADHWGGVVATCSDAGRVPSPDDRGGVPVGDHGSPRAASQRGGGSASWRSPPDVQPHPGGSTSVRVGGLVTRGGRASAPAPRRLRRRSARRPGRGGLA